MTGKLCVLSGIVNLVNSLQRTVRNLLLRQGVSSAKDFSNEFHVGVS